MAIGSTLPPSSSKNLIYQHGFRIWRRLGLDAVGYTRLSI